MRNALLAGLLFLAACDRPHSAANASATLSPDTAPLAIVTGGYGTMAPTTPQSAPRASEDAGEDYETTTRMIQAATIPEEEEEPVSTSSSTSVEEEE